MVRVGILSDSGQVGWQDLVLLAPTPRDVLAVSFGFDYTSSPEKKKPRVQGCGVAGFFGVFFRGNSIGSKGIALVALCTLGNTFAIHEFGVISIRV